MLHIVGFAVFLGGAALQQHLMKASRKPGLHEAIRDNYEQVAAFACKALELPGFFVQIVSGILFVVNFPGHLKAPWLHGKLTAVAILLVLSHVEMINASKIVKARQAGRLDEIETRKQRHQTLGNVGTVCVVAILGLVFFGR